MKDPSQQAKSRRWMVMSAGRLARLQDEAGDRAAARAYWELVRTSLRGKGGQVDAESLSWLARALSARGENDKSRQVYARLRQARYRHPDFVSEPARGSAFSHNEKGASP